METTRETPVLRPDLRHLIPRYADLPDPDVAWGLADRFREIGDGVREGVCEAEVLRVIDAYRAALAENPPPS